MKVPERGFKRLSNWIKAWQKEIWQFACRVYHTKHSILYNIQLWRGRIRWQVFSFSSYCTKRCTYSQRKKSIQYTYINFASKNKLERLKSKSFPFFCCTERQCFRESAMCPRLVFSFLYIPTLLPQYFQALIESVTSLLSVSWVCWSFGWSVGWSVGLL